MSGFSPDVVLLMILVALVTATVLVLTRTRTPTDAGLRPLREDLRAAAGRMLRAADRVLSLAGSRTWTDRARAELLEPPERDRAA